MQNTEQNTSCLSGMAAETLYDLSLLEEMEDNEYLVQVLNIFLRNTPDDLKQMAAALKAGNTEVIARTAHKIKGSAGVIQAADLCKLLSSIENVAKTGAVNEELKALIASAERLYNFTDQALKRHIQELKRTSGT